MEPIKTPDYQRWLLIALAGTTALLGLLLLYALSTLSSFTGQLETLLAQKSQQAVEEAMGDVNLSKSAETRLKEVLSADSAQELIMEELNATIHSEVFIAGVVKRLASSNAMETLIKNIQESAVKEIRDSQAFKGLDEKIQERVIDDMQKKNLILKELNAVLLRDRQMLIRKIVQTYGDEIVREACQRQQRVTAPKEEELLR